MTYKIALTAILAVLATNAAFASVVIDPKEDPDNLTVNCASPYIGDSTGNAVNYKAVWEANLYEINLNNDYYANTTATAVTTGATASPDKLYQEYAVEWKKYDSSTSNYVAFSTMTTMPTYTGYTFDGYFTGKAGTGTQVVEVVDNAGTKVAQLVSNVSTTLFSTGTPSGNNHLVADAGTLYAKWTANGHTVDYYCDECPGNVCTGVSQPTATPQQSINFNDTFTMQNAVTGSDNDAAVAGCTKDGHHATGWICKYLDGTSGTEGSALSNNTPYNKDVNARCTLQWAANSITLTWNPVDGKAAGTDNDWTADAESLSCNYGETLTVPSNPEKTGHTFMGWEIDSH